MILPRAMPARLLTIALAAIALFSCEKSQPVSQPQPPEKAPVRQLPADAPAPAPLTPILHIGGTGPSFPSALSGTADPTPDPKGRPILTDLARPKAISPSGRSLKNTHIFAILIPQTGTTGLFAGGTNNYNDYIQFDVDPSGAIIGRQENQPDVRQNIHAPAGTATPGTPCLLELHPLPEDRSLLLINGKEIARISSLQSLNHFASGYRGIGSASHLGELRFYENLNPTQIQDILLQLRSYWDLPGGTTLTHHHPLQSPAWLTPNTPAATSGPLTLRLTQPSTLLFGGILTKTAPESPAHITLIAPQSWLIQQNPTTPLHFTFLTNDLLTRENLGPHGSYTLLHRTQDTAPWTLISTSSPTPEGLVHFPETSAPPGLYTLAIQHGIPYQESPSAIIIDGQPTTTATILPGQTFTLTTRSSPPGQRLTLTDASSGIPWHDGPADQLQITHRIFRHAQTKLIAHFHTLPGFHPKRQEITLNLSPTSPRLYPGALLQILRRPDPAAPLPIANAFTPTTPWPADSRGLDTDYPPFRTNESFHPAGPPFIRSTHHHTIVPSLSISPNKEKIPTLATYPAYPIGDLGGTYGGSIAAARFSGLITPATTGTHHFTLEINQPATLTIAGKSATLTQPGTLTLEVPTPTLAPLTFELITANHPDRQQLDSLLLWKTPGSEKPVPVPMEALFHPVDVSRERPLAKLTGQFAHRSPNRTTRDLPDESIPTPPSAEKPEAIHSLRPLTEIYLHGTRHAGDPAVAQAAFDLIHARIDAIRTGKLSPAHPSFAACTRGEDLAAYQAAAPFLSVTENHPALQIPSLRARALIASYVTATVSGRGGLTDACGGANDCYSDTHNFSGAIGPAAIILDSPYAYDGATTLLDTQFRFAPGGHEVLYADGTVCFHNVNGRQLHLSGYGSDWFRRIGIGRYPGTPWAISADQIHRLARYPAAYEWFLYKDTYSFLINGRHNGHKNPGQQTSRIAADHARFLIERAGPSIAPADRADLDALIERVAKNPENSITGHRFHYKTLASNQRGADFYIEAKMLSPLIAGPETFAGALPWNMGYGDGFTALMRHANEYANIHRNAPNAYQHFSYKGNTAPADLALWAYAARPGLTQLDHELMGTDRYRTGSGTHAGGTSDGTRGSMGYESNTKATHHFKFYTFTPDGFASLTTDITATDAKHVVPGTSFRTNLNQCDWRAPVHLTRQNGQTLTIPADAPDQSLSLPLDQRYLVRHDGIAYLILPTGSELAPGKPGTLDLHLTTRSPLTPLPGYTPTPEQTTLIQQTKLHETRRAKIFHLSINHGTTPHQAQAAYFVSMTTGDSPATTLLENPPVAILQNHPQLQALRDTRDGTTHAFFRAPGDLKDTEGNPLLKSPHPIILMWRPDNRTLTAQDPRTGCTADVSQFLTQTTVQVLSQPIPITLPATGQPDDRFHGQPITLPVPAP